MADGAVHVDTTPYTLDEVVDQVVALVEAGRRRDAVSGPSDLPRDARRVTRRTWLLHGAAAR